MTRAASVSVAARRARLVQRHDLDGSAPTVAGAAADVVVLHASDPATVYLSALARCGAATPDDVGDALYGERSLVRMLAMRRTLFVVPMDLVAVVHHGASAEVARAQRKRLLTQLRTIPTDPPLDGVDLARWLEDVEQGVTHALAAKGSATGAQLAAAEPRLRTALLPTTDKAYDVRRNITTIVLTLMAAEGRLVRTEPRGSWTSRHHTWESAEAWWPEGIAPLDEPTARAMLVERYLARFGPATVADVQWWTGWTLGATRTALAANRVTEVDLDGTPGLVLSDDAALAETEPAPVAALLPSLDPTPMGWKERRWFLPEDPRPLYDRNGNIGPTIWWAGEVVGAWAVRPDGSIATRLITDRGAETAKAVATAAASLEARLEGTVVVPSFRTPLERELSS